MITRDAPTRPSAVLLVEDSEPLSKDLTTYLINRGLTVTRAATLSESRDLLTRYSFDVLVLDLNLGSEDGLDLARECAARGGPPVIIATSRVDESDRVLGLEIGADDYVLKPYSYRELAARIRAVVRRLSRPALPEQRIAEIGTWVVDLGAHVLRHESGREVRLTVGEVGLLTTFLEHPRRVLTRQDLLALGQRNDAEVFERTIDVLVARLRRKLDSGPAGGEFIQTIHGKGYVWPGSVTWIRSE